MGHRCPCPGKKEVQNVGFEKWRHCTTHPDNASDQILN